MCSFLSVECAIVVIDFAFCKPDAVSAGSRKWPCVQAVVSPMHCLARKSSELSYAIVPIHRSKKNRDNEP